MLTLPSRRLQAIGLTAAALLLASEGAALAQTEPAAPPTKTVFDDPTAAPVKPSPAAAPAPAAPDQPCPPGQSRPTAEPGQPEPPCQEAKKPTEPPGAPPGTDTTDPNAETSSDQALAASSVGIRELEDHSYWFLGVRFRNFIIPKFMINLFVEGGSTVNAFEFGPELTYRRGPLELDMHLGYADYSMDGFLFKERGDPDRAFELASSDMKLLVASIDIMANIPIDQEGRFSFLIGGDVGVAGVLGDLFRSQAYPKKFNRNNPDQPVAASPDDPSAWGECTGAGRPGAVDDEGQAYCDASNNHYRGYSEASLANGGGKPFIVPYLSLPHIAFRAKPFKDTQLRLDTGFSITGFFFGLGAGYRLPI